MIKILVSGATGFIGSRLIREISQLQEYEVNSISSVAGDVAEPATWQSLPSTELVVHLAAKTFVPDSWTDPVSFLRTNLNGTINALEYCRANKARLIFLSSYLYGNPKLLPIDEQAEVLVNNPYALSKKLAEEACQFYSDYFGLDLTILRVFNIYGSGQDDKFLIPSIVRQVLEGSLVKVKDLDPKRDYLYIDDLIDAMICAIENPQRFEIFNIASGISYSVRDVIQIVQSIAGKIVPVYSENIRRPYEIMDTCADITKARRILSWIPRWSLAAGVERLYRDIILSSKESAILNQDLNVN